MTQSVLVLGGSGFIGERVVDVLRARGISFSAPPHSELDIRDASALRARLGLHDTVIILTQPDQQGIVALTSALALSKPKQVVYASTVLVYGSSAEPQKEEAPMRPATSYEQAKFEEEEALRHIEGGHTMTIARLGNVYGGAKNRGLVQKALHAMYGGESLVVAGERQLRDFIHVEDVAKALAHLVHTSHGGIFNITSGKGVTIDRLLTTLERVAGRGIPWVRPSGSRAGWQEGERKDIVGDNSKLIASGFTPKISLEEGLTRTHQEYARSISK